MTDGCRTYVRHRSVSPSVLHRRDDLTDLAHALLDGARVDQHAGSILVARVIVGPPAAVIQIAQQLADMFVLASE